MDQKIPLPAVIRFNVDFISKEVLNIKTSEDVRKRVVKICDDISEKILANIGEKSGEELKKDMMKELVKFDDIIKELDKNEEEKEMMFLLTSHVGDILHAMFEKWKNK